MKIWHIWYRKKTKSAYETKISVKIEKQEAANDWKKEACLSRNQNEDV